LLYYIARSVQFEEFLSNQHRFCREKEKGVQAVVEDLPHDWLGIVVEIMFLVNFMGKRLRQRSLLASIEKPAAKSDAPTPKRRISLVNVSRRLVQRTEGLFSSATFSPTNDYGPWFHFY